jgi:hypothetical protein
MTDWEWGSETHDPRDGLDEAALFVAEGLLSLGLLLRLSAHVIVTSAAHPDAHPFDKVRYGLGWGWHVTEPQPSWHDQFATALVLSFSSLALAVGELPSVEQRALVLLLALNLVVVAGDPLFLLVERRSSTNSQTQT